MRVLFISIAWPGQGERNLYSDLLSEFALNGHEVFVVSASELDDLQNGSREPVNENGMTILRIKTGMIRKTSYLRKSISLLTLGNKISSAIVKHFPGIKFSIILSHTPPITLSVLFRKLKKYHNAYFYLLLKDIWPQGSVDHKIFKKYSIPWCYLRFHERLIYKTADKVGCMSPLGVSYILSHNNFLSESKVEVFPNSIRPTVDFPVVENTLIRQKYGIPNEACVFIFSGNLSKGHGLGFLVDAVKRLSGYPSAFFLIGGSGTHYDYLENSFSNYDKSNVLLYRRLPLDDFNKLMQSSDIGLILLDSCYTVPQFPSRLLSYLDHSKPVLCAVNSATDIGTIVEKNNCGKTVLHGDIEAFIGAVRLLSENPALRKQMGLNSRKLLDTEYNVSNCYNIITKSLTIKKHK
ncbi:MAG TPA: glycosyltransferase family 4 protein [Bacteroidales bacterium]|nr:glycosyltransferase family 4 protein [Bacteroidales bacterium]